jgi:O-antigen/teichoic acid export membrane protein
MGWYTWPKTEEKAMRRHPGVQQHDMQVTTVGYELMQAVRGSVNGRYKRLFFEGVWVAVGQLLRAAGVFLGIRLLTAYVTPAVYGTFTLLNGVVGLGTGIIFTPFLTAALRFYHEAELSGEVAALRKAIRRFLLSSAAGISVVIAAAGMAYTWFGFSTALTNSLFMAVLLFLTTMSAYETHFLTAARKQIRYSIWVATEAWIKPLLAVILIFFWQSSVNAILLGHIGGALFVLALFFRPTGGLKAELSLDFETKDRRLMRRLISFALPLFPLPVLGWIASAGDRYIIGGLLDLDAVGIYAAAYGVAFHPLVIIGNIIETTVRPVYYTLAANKSGKRKVRAFRIWLCTTLVICTGCVLCVFILHDRIAEWLLGSQFRHASALMPWFAAGGALLSITQVLQKPFLAEMQTRQLLVIEIWGAAAALVFTFGMIFAFGLTGAAMAVPMYYGVQCCAAGVLNFRTGDGDLHGN